MTTRAQIRKRVIELLLDKTDVADRVFSSRARQLWPEELPAIVVYTRNETSTEFDTAPRRFKRDLRLAVEVIAKADTEVDDTLDAIADQVEQLLHEDESLGNLVSDCILSDTEMAMAGDGETVFGSCIMTFKVLYLTEIATSAELDDLERVDVTYDLVNSDDNSEAQDTIEVPTG